MRRSRAAFGWMSVAMGVLWAAMNPQPAAAQQFWAAVAISPSTLESGSSHTRPSQADAESTAIQYCAASGARDCKAVDAVWSGCVALARPTKLVVNQYGLGTSATREVAATDALAACVKAGGADCQTVLAPCANDDPRWPSSLPLPPTPAGPPLTVDRGLVGNWKFNVGPGGIWVWQIAANGTYTFASEAGDNAPSHDGWLIANGGKYTLHSESMVWDDQGTYTIQPGGNSVVFVGKLGTGTWLRNSDNPILNPVGNGVRK
jgi:hypothetical protein